MLTALCRILMTFFSSEADPESLQNYQRVVNGQLKLSDTVVQESTDVNGQLKASYVAFEAMLRVSGEADCRESTFTQHVTIKGTPLLKNCNFDTLEILANKFTLQNCKVNKLLVENPISVFSAKVTLEGQAKVDQVIFDKPGGIVYCSPEATVGEIINGKKK